MEKPPATPAVSTPALRRGPLKAYALCFVAGLLIGLLPVGIRMLQLQRDHDALATQMRHLQLENHLATAAVLARHGDYTAARDAASRFFSDARGVVDEAGMVSAQQQAYLQSILSERDAIITLLARGDPAGAERTTAMFVAYRAAMPR